MSNKERSIHITGDVHGDIAIAGGDIITYRNTTMFDAAFINWMSLGSARLVSWLRLFGAAALAGVVVSAVSYSLLGTGGGSPSSFSIAVIHGALGALLGGLIAWYQRSLASALIRIAWVEGGLVLAEILFASLFLPHDSIPRFFGLPILHASMLVSLIAGPWLGLLTFIVVKLAVAAPAEQGGWRRWSTEAIAIVVGAAASGGVVLVLGQGLALDRQSGPVDPNAQTIQLNETYTIPGYTSGMVPQNCTFDNDNSVYVCGSVRTVYPHQDGFIRLPGWLTLSQAVAVLVVLAMIIPASAALSLAGRARHKLRQQEIALGVGFITSGLIGFGLDLASRTGTGTPPDLIGPLAWGLFGLFTGVVAVVAAQLLRLEISP